MRRVVVFLRWYDGDADQLVPLLHAKRNGRRNKELKTSTLDRRTQ
jgi:hypothetical protein